MEDSSSRVHRQREPDSLSSPLSALHGFFFSSFREYALRALGFQFVPPIVHVAWTLKNPPIATVHSSLRTMAYRFVDPAPFMPEWG